MSGSSFGHMFRLTTFGESHGPGLGGIVDGCPPGIKLSEDIMQAELDRRRPGQGGISTTRKEPDQVRILSGVMDGLTTGTAIGFYIANQNQHSKDYDNIKNLFRPGHADYTYQMKYGCRDWRGGGRASARETVCRVAGGVVAGQMLKSQGIHVLAYTLSLGGIPARVLEPETAGTRQFCSPDPDIIETWAARAAEAKAAGDSLGGLVQIEARGVPPGLGEPVFDKLDARLAYALMGVGAVKAVEIGAGLAVSGRSGRANNDQMGPGEDGRPVFLSNHSGGILGGISTGQTIVARAAVKPIPSIGLKQQTIDLDGQPAELAVQGRHDVSAIPRIIPVLEAMTLLVLADFWLMRNSRAAR